MSTEKEFQEPCHDKEKDIYFKNGTVLDKPSEEADKSLAENQQENGLDKSGTTTSALVYSSLETDETFAKESKSDQNNLCTYLKQTATLVVAERLFLIFICIAVAGGFTVPIIIYALDTDRGDNSTLSIDFDVDNCPAVPNTNVQVCLLLCFTTYTELQ